MTNIIKFPKERMASPPQSEVEMRASIDKVKGQFVTEAAVEIAFDVFRTMEKNGCDIHKDKQSHHDLVLVSEAIKSAMYRSLGMKHPLQKFAVSVIEVSETDTNFNMPK